MNCGRYKISKVKAEGVRNDTIDGFRGIAIFMVISIHTGQASAVVYGVRPDTQKFFELGNYGVQLFFVISGFLLSNIYGGKYLTFWTKRSQRIDRSEISSYLRHRFARIGPLWILFLMVAILESLLFNFGPFVLAQSNRKFDWSEFLSLKPENSSIYIVLSGMICGGLFLLWTSARWEDTLIPGGWSIQSEVFNYLFFLVLRRFHFKKITLILMLITLLTLWIERQGFGEEFLIIRFFRYGFISSFLWFWIGVLIHIFYTIWQNSYSKLDALKLFLKCGGGYSFLFILIVLPFIHSTRGTNLEAIMLAPALGLTGLLVSKVKFLRVYFVSMGKVSYFIYFFHFQLLFLLLIFIGKQDITYDVENSMRFELIYSFSTVLSIFLVAFVSKRVGMWSWQLIELPIIKKYR